MATSAELRDQIRQYDQIIAARTATHGTAPPRPRRGIPGYEHGRATDADIQVAAAVWDATWAEPGGVARARYLKRLAEERLAVAEETEAKDAEVRAQARADLERRTREAFLSNPAATEADWERKKVQLMDEALAGEPPIDRIKRQLLASGFYQGL